MASRHEENLSNSANCCESVFSAIFCCNCQTDEDFSEHEHKNEHVHNHVPIPTSATKTQKAEVAEKKHVQLPENVATVSTGSRGSALKKSDTFTDYIHRAKIKIRTMSNVGHEKNFTEADGYVHDRDATQEHSLKDGFSDYINQAKKKIRKTTSIGN